MRPATRIGFFASSMSSLARPRATVRPRALVNARQHRRCQQGVDRRRLGPRPTVARNLDEACARAARS